MDLEARLRGHVQRLAGDIGERNVFRARAYDRAAEYVRRCWEKQGYAVAVSHHVVDTIACRTLEATIPGSSEIVLVGAHYDSVQGCPGANDNATGVAAMIEISGALREARPARTVRFVAFPNEEPPYFETDEQGSRIYARKARERGDDIRAMLSLETIGCYSNEPGSQQYPALVGWLRPDRGNFISVVGDRSSSPLVDDVVRHFKEAGDFPIESIATFRWVPGVGWSDHAAFWDCGYPAVMITDTAPFRYPHYHLPTDTPEKIDYPSFARVTAGLTHVVRSLAGCDSLAG